MPIKQDIPTWNKNLVAFENKLISWQEKIGIVLALKDQKTEDEFLSNCIYDFSLFVWFFIFNLFLFYKKLLLLLNLRNF